MRHLALITLLVLIGCKKKPPEEAAAPTGGGVVADVKPPPPPIVPTHVQEMARNFERVYFDLDQSVLSAESKAALDANVTIMQAHTDVRVEVQGHADERGTTDYNVALGQRRAQSVVDYMQARGISGSRVKTVSYGEERPLVNESSETAWAQNRRAEFVIKSGGDDVVGTTPG